MLRKLKIFSDNYTKKCQDLDKNIKYLNKNINLIEFEYFNASNKLKNISKTRFVEHVVDNTPYIIEQDNNKKVYNEIISKEEKDLNLFNKYKKAFTKTVENLNNTNKASIDPSKDNDNFSVIDDDNVSVASSKFLSSANKAFKNSKLPYIYGTNEFKACKYLGLIDEGGYNSIANDLKSNNVNLNENLQNNVSNNGNAKIENNNKFLDDRKISCVSELERPNFQSLIDSSPHDLMKKTSVEINLQNNNFGSNQINNKINNQINNQNNNQNQNNLQNNQNSTSVKVIENIPSKVPKAPPVVFKKPNSNNVVPNIQKIPEIPNINRDNLNNEINIKSNQNTQNSDTTETNKVASFRDNLNNMFSGRGASKPIIKNTNPYELKNNSEMNNPTKIENNQNIFNEPSKINQNTAFDKPKGINLDNFVRKSNLFDNDEDEEEDNTGLFKKNSTNLSMMIQKKNTQKIIENNNNMLEQENIENNYKSSILKSDILNNRNINLFSEDNLQNEKPLIQNKNNNNLNTKQNFKFNTGLESKIIY